jgi:hypothetical protein
LQGKTSKTLAEIRASNISVLLKSSAFTVLYAGGLKYNTLNPDISPESRDGSRCGAARGWDGGIGEERRGGGEEERESERERELY